jgi:hypothetical protein
VKKNLSALLGCLYAEGTRKFYIVGGSDLAGLIEMVVQENAWQGCEILKANDITSALSDGVVLLCRENVEAAAVAGVKVVNVIEELAKDEALLGGGVS